MKKHLKHNNRHSVKHMQCLVLNVVEVVVVSGGMSLFGGRSAGKKNPFGITAKSLEAEIHNVYVPTYMLLRPHEQRVSKCPQGSLTTFGNRWSNTKTKGD